MFFIFLHPFNATTPQRIEMSFRAMLIGLTFFQSACRMWFSVSMFGNFCTCCWIYCIVVNPCWFCPGKFMWTIQVKISVLNIFNCYYTIDFCCSSKPTGGVSGPLGTDHASRSGHVRRSITVPSDWMCTICGCVNFARRTSCFQVFFPSFISK